MAKTAVAAEWVYSRDGKVFGPISAGQLQELCQTGRLGAADLICRVGSEQWVAAGTICDLFPLSNSPPTVVDDVPIHPLAADVSEDLDRVDRWWRMAGAWFCVANLSLCLLVGLVKSPPAIVRSMEGLKRSMRHTEEVRKGAFSAMDDAMQNVKKVQLQVEKNTKELSNE